MRASTSRFVYCLGLLAVTACAVLPEALPSVMAASHTEANPLTTEMRLAQAIRGRVELAANVPLEDPSMVEAIATETALRDLAFADDAVSTRRDLIYALTDELSDALAEREHVAETHPARAKADAVVTGLTAAINTEVRRNRI